MPALLSNLLFAAAIFGLFAVIFELVLLWRHYREAVPLPPSRPGISILKPLCGLEDGLAENIEVFASLDYPRYELVLGVRREDDPSWPIAQQAARRHPERVRAIIQRGDPGLNAKVNQLATLAREARHDILVVSDSNVRVGPRYLDEIAAQLSDSSVALVTHGIVGTGGSRLGSLMDRLHLATFVTPGMVAPARLFDISFVVGKSMALRRQDLRKLGGFEAYKDVLAEDYLIGRDVRLVLGREVRIAHTPVVNVSGSISVVEFYHRWLRWDTIQHKLMGRPLYAAQLLLNPPALALLGLLSHPSGSSVRLFLLLCAAKSVVDGLARSWLEGSRLRLRDLLVTPLKDLVAGAAFAHALLSDTVIWRGNRLRVARGTKLLEADAS